MSKKISRTINTDADTLAIVKTTLRDKIAHLKALASFAETDEYRNEVTGNIGRLTIFLSQLG